MALWLLVSRPLVALEPVALELEPILITKSRPHILYPYSLKSELSEELPFDSSFEALGVLPVDLQSRLLKSGIQTDFSLRGSSFQGVLMLLNGQRINDPQTAHHNSDIPLTKEDIRMIDVLPGISSSLFGPDAIGGAINIITKKPQDRRLVLELSGGMHKKNYQLLSLTERMKDFGLRFSLERDESAGFRFDTDFKKLTAAFASSLQMPGGELSLDFGWQDKEFGAFDFYTPGRNFPSREWTKTYLANTGLNLERDGFIVRPNFLWRRHYDKFVLDKTQALSRYLAHHRTDIYTPNIYVQRETGFLGKAGLGLEYGQEIIHSTTLGKHTREHKSIFMDNHKNLNEKLSLGLSLRYDSFGGFDPVYTGSFSLNYQLAKNDFLNLGASRSMRVPSFTELYYNDPTTVGNASLSAERSLNYQLGYEHRRKMFSLGLVFFLRSEDNFIDWVKHSSFQPRWQAENISQARAGGIEGRFNLRINEYLNWDSNYSYLNKRIEDSGLIYKYGQNYARHLANTVLILKLPFGAQSFTATYKQKPGRPGWFLLNTRLSYNLNKKSQVFFEATNILNTKYEEISGIPQPARWVEAGLRVEW